MVPQTHGPRAVRGRRGVLALAAVAIASLSLAACSSSADPGSSSSAPASSSAASASATASGGSTVLADAQAAVEAAKVVPSKILVTGNFTPKPGAKIYDISCNLSIVGCQFLSSQIGEAAKAIGYEFKACDGGATAQQANGCFDNAVTEKPDVVVVNGIGAGVAGDGYAKVAAAGIPIVGVYTGNTKPVDGVKTELGTDLCTAQGVLVANAIIANTDAKAKVLFLTENAITCDTLRAAGFKDTLAKCSDCSVEFAQFDLANLQTVVPQTVTSKLQADPSINYVVGVFDDVALAAATAVRQLGSSGGVRVAGMDGNPANFELLKAGDIQDIDAALGLSEAAWASIDAAARVFSGSPVQATVPLTQVLITPDNVASFGKTGYLGATGYQDQFKSLWGM